MLGFIIRHNGKRQGHYTNYIDIIYARDAESHGYIVHHKSYIDTSNIWDTDITLNFDNLELLCIDCHNKEHFEKTDFTHDGELKPKQDNILKLAGVYKS